MKVQWVFCSYSTTSSKASGFPLTLSIFRGSFAEPASTRWRISESFAPILLFSSKASGFPLTLSIFRGSQPTFVEPASTRWRFSESFAPIPLPAPKHQGFPWLYPSFGGLNQLFLNLHLLDEGSVSLLLLFYYQLQSIRVSPDFIHLSGVFCWTSIY